MRWDRSHQSSNVEDRRGQRAVGGGAGGLPIGSILAVASRFGWKGILVGIVLVVGMMFFNPCSGAEVPQQQVATSPNSSSEGDLAGFVGFVLDDVNTTWKRDMPNYRETKLVLFRGAVDSACGTASAAVGPFYCPIDSKVYIDLAFYEQLRARFGAPGDFAQAYVI
ncbi:MAG: neutral zinc metallopeptidase, partial [Deltaproteobacteria bacterium]|nr:neutral zinc metallopeptidase [Deltaproteobacteria bacterium]